MLVLSRKKNESIDITGEIAITVVEIRGDKVRLGIEAPAHVNVARREIALQIGGVGRIRRKDQEALLQEEVGPPPF